VVAGVSETTAYVGPYEAWTQAGVTKYRYHLMADDREVAEVDLTNNGSAVNEAISYVLTDHLGSVDVVTDQNGNIVVENGVQAAFSFGAFGDRRNPTTWMKPQSSSQVTADHQADRYGFTHQEMLDNVNLIHMNGRVYDPSLGRFLSVDPVFEFPTNMQSLNPYSYVLNNPLSMTDPTGYSATDGSICTTGAGFSMGCSGQDLHSLQLGQFNSLVSKAEGAAFLYGGAKVGQALTNYLNNKYGNLLNGNGASKSAGISDSADSTNSDDHTKIGGSDQNGTSINGVQITGEMKPVPGFENWLDTNPVGQIVNQLGDTAGWAISPFRSGQTINPLSDEYVTGERLFNAKFFALTAIIPADKAASAEGEAAKGLEGIFDEAFHYTFSRYTSSIEQKGLREGSYATPIGTLSPLQAHIDLALPPNRGLPNSMLRVDLRGLRAAGYEIPPVTQVGRDFNMPGGGYQMHFPYSIPPDFLSWVKQ
jgi:RHS repeat-associated protein